MNAVQTILLVVFTFVTVFVQSVWQMPRMLMGAQFDLLPPLIVCAALTGNFAGVILVAVCGGLGFDSLSANPMGVSVLPLLVAGAVLHHRRHLILRHEPFAQIVVGTLVSAAVPLMTVISLMSMGLNPLLGWYSLWQWLVITLVGGAVTPLLIKVFGRLGTAFTHPEASPLTAHENRELKRGRD